jgi:phosphate transport system protein
MNVDLPSQLLDLRRSILAMAALVDSRVQRVTDSIKHQDFSEAEPIRHGDREVDEMEIDIEEHCLEILALQQPVARDLRFILASLRVNGELERIGDLAKGVAKRMGHLNELGFTTLPVILGEMADSVRVLLGDTIRALADNDANLARQIRREDQRIDDFEDRVREWGQAELLERPSIAAAAFDLMIIARSLERIGDMCTNIAEDVIFLVDGAVVRHTHV